MGRQLLVECHSVTLAVHHGATRFFDHEHTGADVPFMNIAERNGGITVARSHLGEAVRDTAHPLDTAMIDEDLKPFLRLRAADQQQGAVDLLARTDPNRLIVQISALTGGSSVKTVFGRIVDDRDLRSTFDDKSNRDGKLRHPFNKFPVSYTHLTLPTSDLV